MTDRYLYWQQQLQQANDVMALFGAAAMALVGAWYLLSLTPPAVRMHLQRLYMIGGYVLFVFGLIIAWQLTGGKP